MAPIFRDHPTARFVTIVRDIREIEAGVVLLRAEAGIIPPGKEEIKPERNVVQLLLASNSDAGWRVELFQNTPAAWHGRPEAQEKLTTELQRVADEARASR